MNNIYYLMWKDQQVLVLDGSMVKVINKNLLPHPLRDKLLLYDDVVNWAKNRLIPTSRCNAYNILSAYDLDSIDLCAVINANHLATLKDSFWMKESKDRTTWKVVSLYSNTYDEWVAYRALLNITTVTPPKKVSPELTTGGISAKAWFKLNDGIYLFKVGQYELAAAKIMDTL